MGLVNGAKGTVVVICYRSCEETPCLPIAVTVRFDSYRGPTRSVLSATPGLHLVVHALSCSYLSS